jgi:hypothetical protein
MTETHLAKVAILPPGARCELPLARAEACRTIGARLRGGYRPNRDKSLNHLRREHPLQCQCPDERDEVLTNSGANHARRLGRDMTAYLWPESKINRKFNLLSATAPELRIKSGTIRQPQSFS